MQLYLETPIPNIAFEKTGFSKLPWSTVIHSPTVWTLSIHGDANYFMAQILWKLVPKSPFSWLISFPLKFCILTLKSNRDMEIEKCVKLFSQSKSNYLHLGQHCHQMYFPWFWIRNFQNQIPRYSQFQSCRNALVSSLMAKCWKIILVDIECSLLFKPGKVLLSPLKGWSNITRYKRFGNIARNGLIFKVANFRGEACQLSQRC